MSGFMFSQAAEDIYVYVYVYKRDSFGLRNTKECSMTYRQSETYICSQTVKTIDFKSNLLWRTRFIDKIY